MTHPAPAPDTGGSTLALVGPGAIGATVAACVHAGGRSVTVCGHTARTALEIRADDGLDLPGPLRLPGPVHTDPAAPEIGGPFDVVLVAVKDTQLAAAAPWLDRLCGPATLVGALQNGVEQVERVGRWCPASTVVPVVVWFSAIALPDEPAGAGGPLGVVRLRTAPRLTVPDDDSGWRLAVALGGRHLVVETAADFTAVAWHKLLVNAAAGLMALTGRHAGMFAGPRLADLTRRYLAEGVAVARAEGADLPDEVIETILDRFRGFAPDQTTSILTDRERGRPLEWDVRNGVIGRRAARHGIPTPISDVVATLLATASDGPG